MIELLIERLDEQAFVNGVRCQVWLGTTPDGGRCKLYVMAIGANDPVAYRYLEGIQERDPKL